MTAAPAIVDFFERTLPTRASDAVHKLFSSTGSIAFRIGSAAWTFRFANAEPVERRFDRDAQLQLWFSEPAFMALIDGSLDITAASGSGEVKARGDLRLLELFGRFLQRDEAALGWTS